MAIALAFIPAITAISAAGGVAAALTVSFASFAAVAGGFMVGAGILTKDKNMQRFGSLLSLAGGITNLVSGAANASSAASAGEVVPPVWEGAATPTSGMDAAQLSQGVEASGAGSQSLAPQAAPAVADIGNGYIDGLALPSSSVAPLDTGSLVNAARTADLMDLGPPLWGETAQRVAAGAGDIKSADHLQALLDSIGRGAKGVTGFVKDNKELVDLAGKTLASMNDPRYEELDYAKSIRAARMRNLNSPVSLGLRPLTTSGG